MVEQGEPNFARAPSLSAHPVDAAPRRGAAALRVDVPDLAHRSGIVADQLEQGGLCGSLPPRTGSLRVPRPARRRMIQAPEDMVRAIVSRHLGATPLFVADEVIGCRPPRSPR